MNKYEQPNFNSIVGLVGNCFKFKVFINTSYLKKYEVFINTLYLKHFLILYPYYYLLLSFTNIFLLSFTIIFFITIIILSLLLFPRPYNNRLDEVFY